jgi:hypothetical protein
MSKTVNNADQINAVITTNGDATASVDFTPTQDTHVVNKAYVDTAIGNIPAPVSVANPNLIINGGFDVWQRGTSFGAGTSQFSADRWFLAGTDKTCDRSMLVPTGENFAYSGYVASTTSAASFRTPLELSITGEEAPFNIGTTYTLSFWINDRGAGGAAIRAHVYFCDGSPAANAVYNLQDSSQTTAATNVWKKVSYTFSITNAANPTNTSMNIEVGLNGVGSCNITGVKLEQGSVATPWFYEDIGTTLAKCQRYYERLNAYQTQGIVGQGIDVAATIARIYIKMHPKRINPTVSGTTMRHSTGQDCTNPTIWIVDTHHIGVAYTAAVLTTNQPCVIFGRSGQNDWLAFDAEL